VIKLQPTQAKVELSSSAATSAYILVGNEGTKKVSDLKLLPLASGEAPVKATVVPLGPTLKPGETRSYKVELPAWKSAAAPSPLTLLATYATADGIKHAVTAAIELSPPTPVEVEKVASVEVKASLATLHSEQSQPVYLLVKNKAAQVLTVKKVDTSNTPSFISFHELPKNVEVEPGETSILKLEAKAGAKVRPGEHELVFRLPSEMGGAQFDLVASEATKVGVEGEAELLTVFGIPSLLVLPGFLVLVGASIVWRLRWLRQEWDTEAFPFALKEPEFWALAVIASILIVVLAHAFKLIDLLGEYGIKELIELWFASLLLGAAICLAVVFGRNKVHEYRVPSDKDKPIEVLRKLGRQHLTLMLPEIQVEGSTDNRFLLQPENTSRPSTWASPAIVYSWNDGIDNTVNEAINHQLNQRLDPQRLAELLDSAQKANKLEVKFKGDGTPSLVAQPKITINGRGVIATEA
jgi:hypothetical protein